MAIALCGMNYCYNGRFAKFVILKSKEMERNVGFLGGTREVCPWHPTRLETVTSSGSSLPTTSWRSSATRSEVLPSSSSAEVPPEEAHTHSPTDTLCKTFRTSMHVSNDSSSAGIRRYPQTTSNSFRQYAPLQHSVPNWHNKFIATSPNNFMNSGLASSFSNYRRPFPFWNGSRRFTTVPGMDHAEIGESGVSPSAEFARDVPYKSPRSWKKLKISGDILSTINDLRQWDYTDLGKSHQKKAKSGVEFTIMSYNVLAQELLLDNSYLYRHCDERALSWNHRRKQLFREFCQSNADILCLQEVQCDHYKDFYVPELRRLGYEGTYKKRTGNKKDGCAIFYKVKKFTLDAVRTVEFRCINNELSRDNIAILATLRPLLPTKRNCNGDNLGKKSTGQFCVANTHLLFNPGRGDIKLAQLRILMAEMDRVAKLNGKDSDPTTGYQPILLCGDMNSEPHCPVLRFVCTGKLAYEGLTAGDVSGQHGGCHKGRFQLRKELVPLSLGISDQCQYVKTLEGCSIPTQNKSNNVEVAENVPSDKESSSCTAHELSNNPVTRSFSSGTMSHQFNLVSAYNHTLSRLSGESEVTTHHKSGSCTVDYIFYSVKEKNTCLRDQKIVHNDVKEGDLALLATHGLLGCNELEQFGGLPNEFQPSDHLPLMAKFLLGTDCN